MKFLKFLTLIVAASLALTSCDKKDDDNVNAKELTFRITIPTNITGSTATVTVVPSDKSKGYMVGYGPKQMLIDAYRNDFEAMFTDYYLAAIREGVAGGYTSWQEQMLAETQTITFTNLLSETDYYILVAGVELSGDGVNLTTEVSHSEFTTTNEVVFDGTFHIYADHTGNVAMDRVDEAFLTFESYSYEQGEQVVTLQLNDRENLKMCFVEFFVDPADKNDLTGVYTIPMKGNDPDTPRFTPGYTLMGFMAGDQWFGTFFAYMNADGDMEQINTAYVGSLEITRAEGSDDYTFTGSFYDYKGQSLTFNYDGPVSVAGL